MNHTDALQTAKKLLATRDEYEVAIRLVELMSDAYKQGFKDAAKTTGVQL